MKRIIKPIFLSGLLLVCVEPWAAADDWQLRMLNQPSDAQLLLEKKGRVFIYDGLTDVQVEQAVDQQFERMGSMMFVRTVLTDTHGESLSDPESGEPMVEDDGCD